MTSGQLVSRGFRELMAHHPAGVAVVTTLDRHGRPAGLTTTAINGVSLDPPLLLVCVDRASRTLSALLHRGRFTVNFLDTDHAAIARRFASKADDKFAALAWTHGANTTPILAESRAWAECTTEREIEAGDHVVLIGQVTDAVTREHAEPSLVYAARSFVRCVELDPLAQNAATPA